jgi:hypothetical protein
MAYVGETPWHGLGQSLTPDANLDTWTREAGFDWTVKKGAIAYEVRDENDAPMRGATSRDTRLQSAWFGAGARLKRDALDTAIALV